ncbi:MAG: CBS domain-containing protein [Candidatus Omnitrophota bacterium]
MKVKEIMTKDVKSIPLDINVHEALKLLKKMQISGLPVIDENGKLLGMFTEKEVLGYILPSYIEKVGRFVYSENLKSTKRKFNELANIKVSQIMRKDVVTVNEETTLCEIARVMLTQRARRLPILDKTGRVVGIVARADVLEALTKEADIP